MEKNRNQFKKFYEKKKWKERLGRCSRIGIEKVGVENWYRKNRKKIAIENWYRKIERMVGIAL